MGFVPGVSFSWKNFHVEKFPWVYPSSPVTVSWILGETVSVELFLHGRNICREYLGVGILWGNTWKELFGGIFRAGVNFSWGKCRE